MINLIQEPVELGSTAILNFEPLQKCYNIVLFVSAFKTNSCRIHVMNKSDRYGDLKKYEHLLMDLMNY